MNTQAKRLKPYHNRRKLRLSHVLTYVALSFWALTTIYPFLWVIINSFKDKRDILTDSFSIPVGEAFTTSNYTETFEKFKVLPAYVNSLVISGCVTILVVLISGLAAYALARYSFPGRNLIRTLLVASMMFPVFATIIPVFTMEAQWGIVNTSVPKSWLSVILPQTAGNIAFATIVLMGYIQALPVDLEEAAYLEGYGPFRIFFKIIVPLARPSFATVAIFTFLWSYNDLFTQMFFLRSQDYFTITRLLNEISSLSGGTNYGWMAAAVVIVVLPVLAVYIVLQRNIIKGLTAGSVKG